MKIPRSLAPSFDTLVILLITTMIATALLLLFYVGRGTLIHGNTRKWLAYERWGYMSRRSGEFPLRIHHDRPSGTRRQRRRFSVGDCVRIHGLPAPSLFPGFALYSAYSARPMRSLAFASLFDTKGVETNAVYGECVYFVPSLFPRSSSRRTSSLILGERKENHARPGLLTASSTLHSMDLAR